MLVSPMNKKYNNQYFKTKSIYDIGIDVFKYGENFIESKITRPKDPIEEIMDFGTFLFNQGHNVRTQKK